LDRIDLHVDVPAVSHRELTGGDGGESSETVRERVISARRVQAERFKDENIYANARMSPGITNRYCRGSAEAEKLLELAMGKLSLSARAYHRILRVARTIADLEECGHIETHHMAEAIQYRSLDKESR
jgi:magnesium chelatase family protein